MTEKKDESPVRYNRLIDRSFMQLLRYKIYDEIICQNESSLDVGSFLVSEEIKSKFATLYDPIKKLRNVNRETRIFLSNNKITIKNYKKKYIKYFEKENLSYEDFQSIWDNGDRRCAYCGISEDQIKILINGGKILTKRLYVRGKTMEIDRIDPNGEYDKKNIILSCYWCNNAKTDEFDLDEFKIIAKEINHIWSKRLGMEISFPW